MTDPLGTFSKSGVAIVNGVRMTWPMAALTVTAASLRVDTIFGGHYEFRHEQIRRLELRWRMLWPGIQIEHSRPDMPRDLWFMTWYRPSLVRELARLGWRVV